MRLLAKWLSAAACITLAACGATDEERDTTDTAVDAAGAGAVDVDALVRTQQMVRLTPRFGSPLIGEAMLAPSGERTEVVLRLMGAPGSGTHASHIHRGSCEQQGEVVAPVGDVVVDASGTGSTSATLDLPLATVMNGQHYIQAHESVSPDPGQPIACGNIPAQSR